MWTIGGGITGMLCFFVLLCFLNQGLGLVSSSQCPPSTLNITEVPTERQIESKTEWNVSISITCPCTILQLKLSCPEFKSVTKIDPSVISQYDGSHCLVNNGQPLYGGRIFNFTYAGDRVNFVPFDYIEACS
ncbi:hypothetical protein OROMI_017602 [Orobanche minor]